MYIYKYDFIKINCILLKVGTRSDFQVPRDFKFDFQKYINNKKKQIKRQY